MTDDYVVAGTSDYLEGANELLDAHRIINKNKSISFSIVNLDEPLILTDEIKQMELEKMFTTKEGKYYVLNN